jgi:hypothetical protein
MKLTKIIIEHWKIWMSVPVATNIFGYYDEGLGFYDWYLLSFCVAVLFDALSHFK